MTTTIKEAAAQPLGAEASAVAPEVMGLYDKLAAISQDAAPQVTGHTGQKMGDRPAFSIGDVESALKPLFAKYGLVTRWSTVELSSYEQPTREGTMRMWIAHLRVKVTNAALPDESFEDEWIDIGTNPMAAASFVRKGYYKALFHLAEEGDEARGQAPADGGGTPARAQSRPEATNGRTAPHSGGDRPLGPCVECAELGITAASGKPAAYWPPKVEGKPPRCNGCEKKTDGTFYYYNHTQPVEVPAGMDDVSPDENGRLPWDD